MIREPATVIDGEKCTGCGLCVAICPAQTLSLREEKAVVTGAHSLRCGQCQAVCPADAVQVKAAETESLRFHHFDPGTTPLAYGKGDTGELVRLMLSRRSCRKYSDEPVSEELIADLIRVGTTAPSGTNSQAWTFTVIPDRAAVTALAEQVQKYFDKLNKMAEKPWLRKGMALLGKPELETYYQGYYETVREAMADWRNHGKDRLFHGATAAILIGAKPGASCPSEDALLATQNILLAAHTLGLGTCLIGFVKSAMDRDPAIKRFLGIPEKEPVYSVIGLGHPKIKYREFTGRKPIQPRYFRAGGGQ